MPDEHPTESDLPEYPTEVRDTLEDVAIEEFAARLNDHGHGKNWLTDEPRVHLLKATDELFLARGRDDHTDHIGMTQHIANALNHMLFALEIAENNPDYTPPDPDTDTEEVSDREQRVSRLIFDGQTVSKGRR